MVRHGIPVTPLNYALWYTYVTNEDPTLNQRIDEIVSAYGTLPLTSAEGLFREHVSPTGSYETALDRVKDRLEQMVQGIDHDLNATLADTRSFSSLLDECSRDLRSPSVATPTSTTSSAPSTACCRARRRCSRTRRASSRASTPPTTRSAACAAS
jgi:hypothetical protein